MISLIQIIVLYLNLKDDTVTVTKSAKSKEQQQWKTQIQISSININLKMPTSHSLSFSQYQQFISLLKKSANKPNFINRNNFSIYFIIMEQQSAHSNNPNLQTQSEVNSSVNSSYMFDEEQSIQQGGQFDQYQEPKISIKIAQPQQQSKQIDYNSLSYEEKLYNNNFVLTASVRGQQVFNEFLVQLKIKQQLLKQSIQSILDQQNIISEPTMTICMFYLTYIYYYFIRNHETMLSQEFNAEQISLIKTNFSFAKHKKIIGINYQTLLHCNYAGKIRLLEIVKESRRKPQKSLRRVLGLIGPCLGFVHEPNIPNNLKKVGVEMWFGSLDMAYSKIEFNELLKYFQSFMLANKIKLKPTLKEYLKIFECDQSQP